MNLIRRFSLSVVALAAMVLSLSPFQAPLLAFSDGAEVAAKTEDIIYMTDGRELHGQIISETSSQIVFEYRDPNISITAKLTLDRSKVAHIERDVLLESPKPDEQKATPSVASTATSSSRAPDPDTARAARQAQTDDLSVASFYIVPMRGQMGTDVSPLVYEELASDIRQHNPDVIIIEMNCKDIDRTLPALLGDLKPEEIGLLDFEESRKLVDVFHDDLRDIRQVLWIHDAVGISSNVALSWKDLYMTSTARLGGMIMVLAQTGAKGWSDTDIRAKMTAAVMAIAKSFLVYGGYAPEIADAMIDPEFLLSATWRGRNVAWMLNDKGAIIVDDSDEKSVNFTAKAAEDFCISDGTADNLDDLALLLGYREYRLIEGKSQQLVDNYITSWRRAFNDAKKQWDDYQKYLGWASGEDALKYLGRAKSALENILSAMERYKAVEIRLSMELGLSKVYLQVEIEKLQEQIRQIKDKDQPSNKGRGGTRRGGSGVGGVGG